LGGACSDWALEDELLEELAVVSPVLTTSPRCKPDSISAFT
jgi:hypothetical protein